MDTFSLLQSKRSEFNKYNDDVVLPLLKISEDAANSIGFVAIARRLTNESVREKYCQLAADMLDANIEFHSEDAKLLTVDTSGFATRFTVSTTLIAAALGNYLHGMTVALLAAAACYWIVDGGFDRVRRESLKKIADHNGSVDEWVATLNDWKSERDELRSI